MFIAGCSGYRAKAHISSVDKVSQDLRHNPSEARLPMSAVLRTQTRKLRTPPNRINART